MRKTTIISLLLTCALYSCNKPIEAGYGEAMNFTAHMGDTSKGIVDNGSILPDNYTVYVSSYFNSMTSKTESKNNFVALPFNKSLTEDYWIASPTVYWPLGGSLTFLCVACQGDRYNISNANWSTPNCTDGVELNVTDYSMLSSELLYTNAATQQHQQGSVDLTFNHSQAWVRFALSCEQENLMLLDSIVMKKVYVGGKFTVRNDVFATGEWSFRGHYKKNIVVTSSRNQTIGTEKKNFDVLLPEQTSCDYVIYYRMKNNEDQTWEEAQKNIYYGTTSFEDWYYGTRYLYSIKTTSTELSVSASVQDWKKENYEIELDKPETTTINGAGIENLETVNVFEL